MNVLIIDDIVEVAASAVATLNYTSAEQKKGPINAAYFHYDVNKGKEQLLTDIVKRILNECIEIIALDRKYNKTVVQKGFVCKVEGEQSVDVGNFLAGVDGLLPILNKSQNKAEINLRQIIIYTYDTNRDYKELEIELENLKSSVSLKATEYGFTDLSQKISAFETSSIFNRPDNQALDDPNLFYPEQTIQSGDGKKILGTITAFQEYGNFIGHAIKSILTGDSTDVNSYAHKGNADFDRYLQVIQLLNINSLYIGNHSNNGLGPTSQDSIAPWYSGTVTVLMPFDGKERFLIDIPYKEYYDELNTELRERGLTVLFDGTSTAESKVVDSNTANYPTRRWVFYNYSYDPNAYSFIVNAIEYSDDINESQELKAKAKEWLPYLHGSMFHYPKEVWQSKNIVEVSSELSTQRYNIFFLLDTITIDGEEGTINYTFYRECNCELSREEAQKIAETFLDVHGTLLKAKAAQELIPLLKSLVTRQAIRAAISQVMARNMSHNIGSHVLSKLIDAQQIEHLSAKREKIRRKIVTAKTLTEDEATLKDYYQYLSPHNDTYTSEDDLEVIRQKAAYFNSYLKSRMDFLADIATGAATLESPKLFFNEVIAGLDKNRILLDRISGVDDFHFTLKVRDCRKATLSANGNRPTVFNAASHSSNIDEQEAQDFLVSIPNDILGCHAFYIIIENLIRNTAKHSNPTEENNDTPTVFNIDISDCPDAPDLYKAEIYDSRALDTITPISDDHRDYGKAVVDENGQPRYKNFWTALARENSDRAKKGESPKAATRASLIVYEQKLRINQSILDIATNRVRQGALGLIEMEVSAAYLRKLPVETVDDDIYELATDVMDIPDALIGRDGNKVKENEQPRMPFLVPFEQTDDSGNSFLGYRLYLMKPKEVLLVVDTAVHQKLQHLEDELREEGILPVVSDELKAGIRGKKYYQPHEMMLDVSVAWITNGLDPQQSRLPGRRVFRKVDFLSGLMAIHNKPVRGDGEDEEAFRKAFAGWKQKTMEAIKAFKLCAWDAWLATLCHVEGGAAERKDKLLGVNVSEQNFRSKFHNLFNKPQLFIDALFTNHGDKWATLVSEYTGSLNYLDIADSVNGWKPILQKAAHALPAYDRKTDVLLREAITNQIAIFDERVQSASTNKYKPQGGPEFEYTELFTSTGVYVPSKGVCNLLADNFDSKVSHDIKDHIIDVLCGKEVLVRLGGIDKKPFSFPRISYLVIHLGILEKILKGLHGQRNFVPEKEAEEIEKLLQEITDGAGHPVKVIITTGRGVPGNLPKNRAFINYSAVSQYAIEVRNKFLLTNVLQSARIPQM